MNDSITTIDRLLHEVTAHLKTGEKVDKRDAFEKLRRIASIATTLAFTVQLSR